MRKIVVLTFISLDGVMQAPGGPEEDTSNGFKLGGWSHPFFDEDLGATMGEQMGQPFDLLLGRKTYDLFNSVWPEEDEKQNPGAAPLNKATKYVVSHGSPKLPWNKSVLISGDVVEQLKQLKQTEGPMLQVHGSGDLVQTLLKNDLVDELWLKTYPVTLGSGNRLFGEGTRPATYKLVSSKVTPQGVVVANYARQEAQVKTGSFV